MNITQPKSTTYSQTSKQKTDSIIQWLRYYAHKRINSRLIDERRCIPPYIVLDLGNQGLFGMQVDTKYGGLALNNTDSLRIVEQLAGIDITLATLVVINNFLGVRAVERYASLALREKMLPSLARGRELASFALTESNAGSNPRAIEAVAKEIATRKWQLQGEKIWIGSGSWSGVINLFVQLVDSENKPKGITGFCVPQESPNLAHGRESLTMGMRGVVQNPIILDGVLVDETNLLGEIGMGMTVAQDMMLFTRLAIATKSLGAMKHCAQIMLRYALRRQIGTGKLIDNAITQVRLNYLTTAITALETLVYYVAKQLDEGISLPTEVYIACKTSGPEFLSQAADNLIQMLGGRGYIETNIAPQIFRDARIFRIFEGPTETLNMFFGSCLVKPRKELERFFCEQLNAFNIWQDLTSKVQEINEKWSNNVAPFTNKNTARSWAYGLMGEIGTYSILRAVVQEKYHQEKTKSLECALHWTLSESERIYRQAMNDLSLQNQEETTQVILDYAQSIGDIKQTLLGEDDQLDEFLA